MAFDPQTAGQMDQAAEEARHELKEIINNSKNQIKDVGAWWKKHYAKAGHKRLGRVLIAECEAIPVDDGQ